MASRYGLQIRAATPADLPGIAELMGSAGLTVGPSALADRLEALREERGTALLATEWGPPSGLIVLTWFHTLHEDGRVAQVTTLLVGPDDRRRGIGRLLLKAAAQAARSAGCASLHLLAPAGETSLRDFCTANGFDDTGTSFVRPLRKTRSRDGA